MQGTRFRYLTLIGVLAIGHWLLAAIDGTQMAGSARWPTEDGLYAAGDWEVSPPVVEAADRAAFITRDYRRADGMVATLMISTSPEATWVYRAGPDVPFLGSGHTVESAPTDLVPPAAGRGALIARREDARWLALYAYGERRGLLGNGALGWDMVILDGILGRRNDYFKAYIVAPLDAAEPSDARDVAILADTLFPRLAAWYGG